jgi:glutathione S-transferase
MYLPLTEKDIDDLPRKLEEGEPLDTEERAFLAYLVERFGHEPLSPREQSARVATAVAASIFMQLVAGEVLNHFAHEGKTVPLPKLESLVAEAQSTFGLSRRRIFDILAERRAKYDQLKKEMIEYHYKHHGGYRFGPK